MTTEGMASSGSGGPARKRSPLFTVFFLVVALLIVVGGVLLFQRRVQYQALANETEAAAIPTVAIIHPSLEAGDENLCCRERCRRMWNLRFMRAPTGT